MTHAENRNSGTVDKKYTPEGCVGNIAVLFNKTTPQNIASVLDLRCSYFCYFSLIFRSTEFNIPVKNK
jgi:hypothetical protein